MKSGAIAFATIAAFLVPDEDYQLLADLLAIAPERGELVGRRPGRRHAQAGQAARRRHVADARFDNGAGTGSKLRGWRAVAR